MLKNTISTILNENANTDGRKKGKIYDYRRTVNFT